MGKIYYLMGKSASGKDHIYEHLIQETALDLKPFVLYTLPVSIPVVFREAGSFYIPAIPSTILRQWRQFSR